MCPATTMKRIGFHQSAAQLPKSGILSTLRYVFDSLFESQSTGSPRGCQPNYPAECWYRLFASLRSRNRAQRLVRRRIPPRVVVGIPVRHRSIRPEPRTCDPARRCEGRVKTISVRPYVDRKNEVTGAATRVFQPNPNWQQHRGRSVERDRHDMLRSLLSLSDAVDRDVEQLGAVPELAPVPRQVASCRVFDGPEEITRRWMFERPAADVFSESRVEELPANDVIP